MAAMVKPRPRAVNRPAALHGTTLLVEQALIWLPLGLLALIIYLSGLDTTLAHTFYAPESTWAWALRQSGAWPVGLLAALALGALFIPRLWSQYPLVYQTCAVLVLTAVLGAGLLNQVIIQDLADRPRPRETVLIDPNHTPPAEFSGNSMPSGHAGMGYVLAAPFFVLRRKKRAYAAAALGVGLTAGTVLGLSRMVLGAHFASDVIIAAAVVLSTASLTAWGLRRWPRLPRRYLAAAMALALVVVVLANHFTVTLTRQFPQPFRHVDLPCAVNAVYSAGVTVPTLEVTVQGYGAPISQLRLNETNGIVSIYRRSGLYHGLTCSARLNLPVGPYE
ncbi:MAG: phosphatase PAP2 family protein [Proteobacteria bacterium]|nr:phosphatase PAP2 family protein [Pseudomonadota bacterium]